MRYAVRVHHVPAVLGGIDQILPPGWEPIGGEVEEGNAMRLVLARQLTEEEEAAAAAAERGEGQKDDR